MLTEYEDIPVIRFRLGDGIDRLGFLGFEEIRQLKRLTGMGPIKLSRAMLDDPEPEHIEHVVRLAMIGGGTPPEEAKSVAEYYCRPPRPMETAFYCAQAMLGAWWKGIPKDTGRPAAETDEIDLAALQAAAASVGISQADLGAMSIGEFFAVLKARSGDSAKAPAPDADDLADMMAAAAG